ncbi:hypothetical protein FOA52_006140 [Chlamydomonas sp. UWO 241]|nr:hypothetical protein FOA52_006140 [Chlamydomonas sp. UWO 241]
MEQSDTFTNNEHYFTDSKAKFLERLKMANLEQYDTPQPGSHELWLAKTTLEDDELNMMAAMLAYCKVSFKRVDDTVPMHIRHYLVFSFANKRNLPRVIYKEEVKEMADSRTGLMQLMEEDKAIDAQRRKLQGLKGRLTVALHKMSLPQGSKRAKRG